MEEAERALASSETGNVIPVSERRRLGVSMESKVRRLVTIKGRRYAEIK